MEASIQSALILLLIGMAIVFFVLWSVTLLSRGLIELTNRWEKKKPVVSGVVRTQPLPSIPEKQHLAVITAAVAALTNGRGVLRSMERTNNPA